MLLVDVYASIQVWDAVTGEVLSTLEGHCHYVSSVCMSSDGTKIVSGSLDSTVMVNICIYIAVKIITVLDITEIIASM